MAVCRCTRDKQGDTIIEMVLWQLPRPTGDRPHGLKYRFYCGRRGTCVVRYDNETGKGDHRHVGHREEPYAFTTVEALIEDFRRDCMSLANWSWV
jgi:hypothetical protein